MNSQALWYLTRGSGVVSLLLLTAGVVVGITTSTRWAKARWPRFVVEGLHRNLSLAATIFLGVHIASSVVDTYVSIRWLDAIVPFGGRYKPMWLGLGALSFDIFVAVALTSLVREHLGYRSWRAVHWLAYACFGLAVAHSLGIGTDRHQTWMMAINLGCISLVALSVLWRLATARRPVPAAVGALTATGASR